jgi:hypothetical protein
MMMMNVSRMLPFALVEVQCKAKNLRPIVHGDRKQHRYHNAIPSDITLIYVHLQRIANNHTNNKLDCFKPLRGTGFRQFCSLFYVILSL